MIGQAMTDPSAIHGASQKRAEVSVDSGIRESDHSVNPVGHADGHYARIKEVRHRHGCSLRDKWNAKEEAQDETMQMKVKYEKSDCVRRPRGAPCADLACATARDGAGHSVVEI